MSLAWASHGLHFRLMQKICYESHGEKKVYIYMYVENLGGGLYLGGGEGCLASLGDGS